MLDVEVWEQQLGKGIVLILLPDLRPGKKISEYHFHFQRREMKVQISMTWLGKLNVSKFLSICGKGANNLQYLAYREGKKDCFCSYSYRVLLRSNLSSKYLQALHRHHLLLLDRSVALFSTKGGFLCPGDMWRHLKAFWLSQLAGWMLLVSGD